MKNSLLGCCIFILFFYVGISLFDLPIDMNSISRDPAAINLNIDYSSLSGDSLEKAIKARLLDGIEVKRVANGAGLIFGHFVFKNSKGEKKLACDEFNKIILNFVAEGYSVGGEKPTMEVEGRCEFTTDLTKIRPLIIPIDKILGDKPGDGEFQFREGQAVSVRFASLAEEWPHKWLLHAVRLTNDQTKENFTVESQDILKYHGNQIIIKF